MRLTTETTKHNPGDALILRLVRAHLTNTNLNEAHSSMVDKNEAREQEFQNRMTYVIGQIALSPIILNEQQVASLKAKIFVFVKAIGVSTKSDSYAFCISQLETALNNKKK